MADQDLIRALDQTKLGAAALGVCIARVLIKTDTTMGQRLVDEAEKMEHHLSQNDRTAAVSILSYFRLALAHPENMPLLTPSD